jgi:hypothetical protein
MEHIHSFFLRSQSQLLEAREILKNILKHAVQDRLYAIKEAIPRVSQNLANCPAVVPQALSAQASDSNFSLEGNLRQDFQFTPPMTLRSVVPERAKKRARMEDSVRDT